MTPSEKSNNVTFELIAAAASRQADAATRALRERDKVDELVVRGVTSEPHSQTWYLHPGPMTPVEVMRAAALSESGLHRAVARWQRANPKPAPAKKRRSSR